MQKVLLQRGVPRDPHLRGGPDGQRPLCDVQDGPLPGPLHPGPGALRQQQHHLPVCLPAPAGHLLPGSLHRGAALRELPGCGQAPPGRGRCRRKLRVRRSSSAARPRPGDGHYVRCTNRVPDIYYGDPRALFIAVDVPQGPGSRSSGPASGHRGGRGRLYATLLRLMGQGPASLGGAPCLRPPHAARGPGCPWARGPCCPRGSAPKGSFPCLNSWCPRLPAQPESSREGSGQLPVPGRWLQSRSPRLWFPSRPAQAASRGAASAGTWGWVFGKGSWTCDRWSETPPCRGRLTGLWTPLPARAPGSRCEVWLWSRLLPDEPGAPFSWPCSCAEPRRHFAVGQGLG